MFMNINLMQMEMVGYYMLKAVKVNRVAKMNRAVKVVRMVKVDRAVKEVKVGKDIKGVKVELEERAEVYSYGR